MADLQNILAALAAQSQNAGTPVQGSAPPPLPTGYPSQQYPLAAANQIPYGLPQPVNSGAVDLGGLRPVNSGSVHIGDPRSASRNTNFPNIRSPTPPRGRDSNPYRDERRGANDRNARDRSFSPRRDRFGSPAQYRDRDRSPKRDAGNDSEVVAIDKGLVGLIIGRGGENLRRVESQTGARVQFTDSADTPGTKRHCRVSGSRAAVASAKAEIYKIIEDNELAKRGSDSSRPQDAPPELVTQEGDSLQVMVPDRTVGLIIGRGGETIRDLQERSGCHVNIVAENKSVNGYRPVNLIGSVASQKHAKDLIFEIVESDQKGISVKELHQSRREAEQNSKVNDTMMVPGEAVGMIIGKGGETIRDMQDRTGCKINVSPPTGRDIEREIGLIGSRNAIESAKRAILEKVDAVNARAAARAQNGDDTSYSVSGANAYPQGNSSNAQPATADGADPYAAYGGYDNYARMWYAAMAASQQQQPGGQNGNDRR